MEVREDGGLSGWWFDADDIMVGGRWEMGDGRWAMGMLIGDRRYDDTTIRDREIER